VETEHQQLRQIQYGGPLKDRFIQHDIILDTRHTGYVTDDVAPLESGVGHTLFQLVVIGEELVARFGADVLHGFSENTVVAELEKIFLEGVFRFRPQVGVFLDPWLERLGLRVRHGAVQFGDP
jgi:hypothetical protein